MYHLRRLLELDSGAIRDVPGTSPDVTQQPRYVIQAPTLVTSTSTWVACAVPVSTYIPISNPDATPIASLPQSTYCNDISILSESNDVVIPPGIEIPSELEPLPVLLHLSDLEPSLSQPALIKSNSEENETSESELDGFNPEVVPPVPPEQILQTEKKKKPKQTTKNQTSNSNEVNNNVKDNVNTEMCLTVRQLLKYLNCEETHGQSTNEQVIINSPPTYTLARPVPSDIVVPSYGTSSSVQHQVTVSKPFDYHSHVVKSLHTKAPPSYQEFVPLSKQQVFNKTSVSGFIEQSSYSFAPKEKKHNKTTKPTTSSTKTKPRSQRAPAKKRTNPTKGHRSRRKNIHEPFLKDISQPLYCEDDNARHDVKEETGLFIAEHIIDDGSVPLPPLKSQIAGENKVEEKEKKVEIHDPFAFSDVEPAPDPLSTFRARWCSKRVSLPVPDHSTSHQPPATNETSTTQTSQITPKSYLKEEEPKAAETVIPNTATTVTRVMTRSKSRKGQGELLEPLLPPKRSRKGTKKTSKR
ncbi:uncharacterized protein LOC118268507 isoform X2 [Spodoptera frugiperda]|nr:uncharacterized protein LOC118268507 isoform X2 [Spodoptera frugiperda]